MRRPPHPSSWRALPAGVWALGFGSLFMDASSELIHSLLPVFMVGVLGVSVTTVGLVEGVAEAAASVAKVFSGALSDHLRRRKRLLVLGYALAAATKPLFPLAASVQWVFAARFVDRVGKGIRGAPRDALIADITPAAVRGAAYGLRQALDSVGAVVGPLMALGLMLWLAGDIRAVMWFAVAPAVATVVLLVVYVREPERAAPVPTAQPRVSLLAARHLPRQFWVVVGIGAVFTLARFSEAFLILRAEDVGLHVSRVPLVLVIMNVAYAAGAYPAGSAADRLEPRMLLMAGLALLIVADIVLATAAAPVAVFAGSALWGLHMALTQGLLSKLVADAAPPGLRGTSFGLFNLMTGGAVLLASVIAGTLWSELGPSATFLAGAAFAGAAAAGLLAVGRAQR